MTFFPKPITLVLNRENLNLRDANALNTWAIRKQSSLSRLGSARELDEIPTLDGPGIARRATTSCTDRRNHAVHRSAQPRRAPIGATARW